MSTEQRDKYEQSLIHYLDMKNVIDTAVEEAVEKAVGKAVEATQINIAKSLISIGLDNETIAQGTNLTTELIEKLRTELKKD